MFPASCVPERSASFLPRRCFGTTGCSTSWAAVLPSIARERISAPAGQCRFRFMTAPSVANPDADFDPPGGGIARRIDQRDGVGGGCQGVVRAPRGGEDKSIRIPGVEKVHNAEEKIWIERAEPRLPFAAEVDGGPSRLWRGIPLQLSAESRSYRRRVRAPAAKPEDGCHAVAVRICQCNGKIHRVTLIPFERDLARPRIFPRRCAVGGLPGVA